MLKARTMQQCLLLIPIVFAILSVSQTRASTESQHREVRSFLSGKRVTRSWESSEDYEYPDEQPDSDYDEGDEGFEADEPRFERAAGGRPNGLNLRRFKKPLRNRQGAPPCDSEGGRNNNDDGQQPPWSVDTGIVPEGLQGGETNDGLDGISGSSTNSPWGDIFNANPVDDGNNPAPVDEGSDFPNTDDNGNNPAPVDEGTDLPSTDDNWNSPGPSVDENTDTTWPPAISTDNTQGWPETETSTNGLDSSSVAGGEEPDCTCMSVLACGGTFRSGDVGPDNCEEGEVCCPIERTELPDTTIPPFLSCGIGKPNNNVNSRVMTESTARFGELPWTAMLLTMKEDEETMFCAGVIVGLQVVVTAAHCMDGFKSLQIPVVVRGGEWDTAPWDRAPLPAQDRNIKSVTFHPSYRTGHPSFDLAIIYLDEPFTPAENLNTVCLPSDLTKIDETRCIASGWGKYPKDQQQEVMKKILLPIVSRDQCQAELRKTRLGRYFRLHKSFICAGANGNDVCLGDGGGPLTCPMIGADGSETMVLVGVTSWGIDCGLPGVPGVFADIPSQSTWLEETIALLQGNQ